MKQRIQIDGPSMAYVERGQGDPIVFQRGIRRRVTFGAMSCHRSSPKGGALRSI